MTEESDKTFESQEKINSNIQNEEDEISLIDLFAILWHRKRMIILITSIAAVFSVVFSIISLVLPPEISPLPNQYTPTAYMLINDSSSSGNSLSSMLSSSGLGSLAGMAGVSATGSSYSSLAIYLSTSNPYLDAVVDNFGLIEKWEIEKSPRANSRKALKEVLVANYDEDSAVLSLSFTDIDPQFAQSVVNFSVDWLENAFLDMGLDKNKLEKKNLEENIETSYNEILRLQKEIQKLETSTLGMYSSNSIPSITLDLTMLRLELEAQQQVYTQLKSQYEILKITMASETPVFQILERAEIPDQKSKPSRGMLCIIITFAAGFISVFIAFLQNAIENIKKDPKAMAKLKKSDK